MREGRWSAEKACATGRVLTVLSLSPVLSLSRQPNADTYKKQMDAWCDLVLAYTRHKRIDQLNVDESLSTELFSNAAINRALPRLLLPLPRPSPLLPLPHKSRIDWP